MSDSLTSFRVYRRTTQEPAGQAPNDATGWTEITNGTPPSPIPVTEALLNGMYHIDDPQTPNPTLYYKVIETTANGVVVPYGVQFATMTQPGSIVWAEDIGFDGYEYFTSSDIGSDGSIWAVGQAGLQPTIHIGMFVKLGANGSQAFFKTLQPSSGGYGAFLMGVKTDSAGNAWVTGWFGTSGTGGTFDLGNGHVLTQISPGISIDIFVAKFDPNGVCQLAKNYGNLAGNSSPTALQSGLGIDIDSTGAIVIVGQMLGSVNFGNSYVVTAASGAKCGFVLKLNGITGNTIWAFGVGEEGDATVINCVATDAGNNIYIGGRLGNGFGAGPIDVAGISGPATPLSSQNGGDDAFAAKYNASGVLQNSKNFGGRNLNAVFGISVDSQSRPVIVGGWFKTMDAGAGSITSISGFGTQFDSFIVQLDSSFNHRWSYYPPTAGVSDSNLNLKYVLKSVAHNIFDEVIVSGAFDSGSGVNFTRTVSSAGQAGSVLDPNSGHCPIVKYDKDGNYIYGKVEGAPDIEEGVFISTDKRTVSANGSYVVCGPFVNTITLHNSCPLFLNGASSGNGNTLTSQGFKDGFVLKLTR